MTQSATSNHLPHNDPSNSPDKTSTPQAVHGMHDILPEQVIYWQKLEQTFRQLTHSYGYREIRTPLVEKTCLFERSVGETSDIVHKEMYTFNDRDHNMLSLRPEGTASCVRACIEHSLLYHKRQRLWYVGPMFRHERPQKGRYRQFHHLGLEAFGFDDVFIEVEQLLLTQQLWQALEINHTVHLEINFLGDQLTRQHYHQALTDYFKRFKDHMDDLHIKRLFENPLRILDSKAPDLQDVIQKAPKIIDYLNTQEQQYFTELQQRLSQLGIAYTINPCLVRGLDYYSSTVFEWTTSHLGAQNAVCGGGRYNHLVSELKPGDNTPAFGLAMGCERLIALMQQQYNLTNHPDIYAIFLEKHASQYGIELLKKLREQVPSLAIQADFNASSLKKSLKRADQSQAKMALILGEQELQHNHILMKPLRNPRPSQQPISLTDLITHLKQEYSHA